MDARPPRRVRDLCADENAFGPYASVNSLRDTKKPGQLPNWWPFSTSSTALIAPPDFIIVIAPLPLSRSSTRKDNLAAFFKCERGARGASERARAWGIFHQAKFVMAFWAYGENDK